MKRFLFIVMSIVFSLACEADDRLINVEQLPSAAKEFIKTYFPEEKVSVAYADDDIIRPDYTVILSNGAEIDFENDGSLEKIEYRAGIPATIIPVQIVEYVKTNYPSAAIIGYEVGRREYEVKLSNNLELKFNGKFTLVEIDD